MTDYRFVSAPNVVLVYKETHWASDAIYGCEYYPDHITMYEENGIIEPVPVEIPEHVVRAAVRAVEGTVYGSAEEHVRAILTAAKQAKNPEAVTALRDVEIPEYVVEAANRAYFANHQWFAEKGDAMRAALIAAKQAEVAGA